MSSKSRQKLRNLRCSNRQVTKRAFQLPSSQPSPRRRVQSSPDEDWSSGNSTSQSQSFKPTVSTKVSPLAAYVTADVFKVPRNRSHQDVAELSRSSPLALIVEQDENVQPYWQSSEGTPTVQDGLQTPQDKPRLPSLSQQQQQQQQHVLPEETPPPGDVSVTFLASTPKPGQPQLSRRRPFTATRDVTNPASTVAVRSASSDVGVPRSSARGSESSSSGVSVPPSSARGSESSGSGVGVPRSSARKRKLSHSQQKRQQLHGKQQTRSSFDFSAQSSIHQNEQTQSQSSVLFKQPEESDLSSVSSSRSSKRIANKRNLPVSRKEPEKADKRGNVKPSRKRARNPDLSVGDSQTDNASAPKLRKTGKPVTESVGTVTSKDSTADDSQRDGLTTKENKTKSASRSKPGTNQVVTNSSTDTSKQTVDKAHATDEASENGSSAMGNENVYDMSSSDENTVVKTPTVQRKQLKTSVIKKKKATVHPLIDDNMETAENVTIFDVDGVTRSKGDVVDMDVILNAFTSILTSEVSNTVSQKEEHAVKLLEKYLVQDITSMIRDVHTVKTLQARIRKTNQRLTLRKEELLHLQTQRLELMDTSTHQQRQQSTGNMARINQCLADLKTLIDLS